MSEVTNSLEMTVDKEVADSFSEPAFIYETMTKMDKEFNTKKQQYILKRSQELGINPLIVIQQTALIRDLKYALSSANEIIYAVKAIPDKEDLSEGDVEHGCYVSGYNEALAKVRQTIRKETNE